MQRVSRMCRTIAGACEVARALGIEVLTALQDD